MMAGDARSMGQVRLRFRHHVDIGVKLAQLLAAEQDNARRRFSRPVPNLNKTITAGVKTPGHGLVQVMPLYLEDGQIALKCRNSAGSTFSSFFLLTSRRHRG